jgi:hypothetical protein
MRRKTVPVLQKLPHKLPSTGTSLQAPYPPFDPLTVQNTAVTVKCHMLQHLINIHISKRRNFRLSCDSYNKYPFFLKQQEPCKLFGGYMLSSFRQELV